MHFKMIFLDLACQYLMVKDLFILQRVVVFVSAGRIGSLSGQCKAKEREGISAIYLGNVANYIQNDRNLSNVQWSGSRF